MSSIKCTSLSSGTSHANCSCRNLFVPSSLDSQQMISDPICTSCSFAKFDLWSAGSEVLEFLQYTCSNDIDIPIGKNLSWKYPLSKLDASLHKIVISVNNFLKN